MNASRTFPRAEAASASILQRLRWSIALSTVLSTAMSTALVAGSAFAAPATTLSIALASDLRTIDPLHASTAAEDVVAPHAFESLVTLDAKLHPVAALATRWKQEGEAAWRFELRRGVRFHDGTPLTADDVALSIRTAVQARPQLSMGGKPDGFTVDAVDRSTVRIRTNEAYPFLMQALAGIRIVSAASMKAAANAVPSTGATAPAPLAGTGPYRIAEQHLHGVTLKSYDGYWGTRPHWASISFRAMPNAQERVAAIVAGQVDVIERVPLEAVDRLRATPAVAIHAERSGRLMYLQLAVRGGDTSPLADVRVRRAISEAIDRRKLAESVVHGLGEPAGQLVPPGALGHVPDLYGDRRNVEDARSLVVDAGHPNGFALTLHGPKDVYPGDVAVLESMAGMLRDVGIRADASVEAPATFAGSGSRNEYDAFVRGFTTTGRDASEALVALLATRQAQSGVGALNWSRYSNGTLDSLIQRAVTQSNVDAREVLLQEATRLAMNDVALVPLYFVHDAWATRADLGFAAGPSPLLSERVAARGARSAD